MSAFEARIERSSVRQDPIIQNICRDLQPLGCVKPAKDVTATGVHDRQQIEPAHALQAADIKGVLA